MTMKKHDVDIGIGNYVFPYATSVAVDSSWENLTDTAEIVIPRKISFQGKSIAEGESLFRRADKVNIRLGYDGAYDAVFTGYVSGIEPGVPLRFRCEDEMYTLKTNPKTLSYKNVNLKTLVSDITTLPYQSIDAELGRFRISNATPAQVLEQLRKEYSIQSFFRDGKLYSGLAYWPQLGSENRFEFERDILPSSNLEYIREEDVRLCVKAISIEPDNTKLEVKVGDEQGEQRTLNFYALGSEKVLKEVAERELTRLRFEGFRGSFSTFGKSYTRHGDTVNLVDQRHPDRNGKYLVRKVMVSGGTGGYRQTIYLDTKVG